MSDYTQVCIWEGTLVGQEKVQEFEAFMKDEFGADVKYIEEIETNPDQDNNGNPVEGTGGRNDLLFYIKSDDISTFAIKRLAYGIRWLEDVFGNGYGHLYPSRIEQLKTW